MNMEMAAIPAAVSLPLGGMVALLIAMHLLSPGLSAAPPSRRRIRQANGAVMLLALPLLVAGVSLINPREAPGPWVITWLAVMALVMIMLGLALMDALNTIRLARRAAAELVASLHGKIEGGLGEGPAVRSAGGARAG